MKRCANVENSGVPETVAVGYQPGGYATSASQDELDAEEVENLLMGQGERATHNVPLKL